MIKDSTILIFGTGFIAKNLIDNFLAYNNKIVVVYNNHTIEKDGIVTYHMDDDFDKILLNEKPQYIICVNGNSVVSNNTSIITSIETNVLQVLSFMEHIFTSGYYKTLEKILIIGSASEYGKLYSSPVNEEVPIKPISIYGLTKIILQQTSQYFVERGLPIVYARQFNTTGPEQRDSFVIPSFVKQVIAIENGKQEPVIKVGDLSQERDFLDIKDTCSAYERLLEKGVIGEVYNIGSGSFYSIGEILDLIIKLSKLNKEDIIIKENKNLFSKEYSLSSRLYADNTKLKLLGFEVSVTIEETIKKILNYWREKSSIEDI